ncbi:3-dehydroquinate synthase [Parachryseolinea silvisoli]|jgi:3-dehydroquinate synthase|uniref:3-dehydroquinate synthase n=1 Tax=Parachryseolinea silvisoli TaxID=2873601 RepID=UPI002265D0F1|nr:3-dehydroquinate synthase [Parachryseolinea silvisoli]MCD9018859.1 3-dehydroquinate synthase [Parachryseolinea silvisoli]
MEFLQQTFSVRFDYKVFFTTHLFSTENPGFREFLTVEKRSEIPPKVLFVLDDQVVSHHPRLLDDIKAYFKTVAGVQLVEDVVIIPGGEAAKNDEKLFYKIVDAVNDYKIDRHSYLVAIGGGSILDLAGYAAAVSHRGIRHIRIPTTVLSQNDSGVGVKNGINFYTKKNFLGTFAPPVAVFNDFHFLTTLQEVDWRSGISEAIKVALIKDATFFQWLVDNAVKLAQRDMPAMQYLVKHCADLHMQHIRSSDPFEQGSSRPLDFGHWSAHKLEQLAKFNIRHGEAVAIGIALDTVYSHLSGRLTREAMDQILQVIETLGLPITHPLLEVTGAGSPLLKGLEEFREHLGGKLTITLLKGIGHGEEVHEMDGALIQQASEWLKNKK